jgi:hypothetical protein
LQISECRFQIDGGAGAEGPAALCFGRVAVLVHTAGARPPWLVCASYGGMGADGPALGVYLLASGVGPDFGESGREGEWENGRSGGESDGADGESGRRESREWLGRAIE